jgi:hypothetical protein
LRIYLADCEANGLDPSVIHCVVVKSWPDGERWTFLNMQEFECFVDAHQPDRWVFHNGLGYDVRVLNKLVRKDLIDPYRVVDTLVVSKLVNYKKFSTHSLKELGTHLKVFKGDYEGGWDYCSKEMVEYCEQDVEVLEAIFNFYKKQIFDPEWRKAMRVEHDMAIISSQMSLDGFKFNLEEANSLLSSITKEIKELEDNLKLAFPPELKEVKRLKYRVLKDSGEPVAVVKEAMEKYPSFFVNPENELVCFDFIEFNPASPKDRIDALWAAGWKPVDKTEGHKDFLKSKRKKW